MVSWRKTQKCIRSPACRPEPEIKVWTVPRSWALLGEGPSSLAWFWTLQGFLGLWQHRSHLCASFRWPLPAECAQDFLVYKDSSSHTGTGAHLNDFILTQAGRHWPRFQIRSIHRARSQESSIPLGDMVPTVTPSRQGEACPVPGSLPVCEQGWLNLAPQRPFLAFREKSPEVRHLGTKGRVESPMSKALEAVFAEGRTPSSQQNAGRRASCTSWNAAPATW